MCICRGKYGTDRSGQLEIETYIPLGAHLKQSKTMDRLEIMPIIGGTTQDVPVEWQNVVNVPGVYKTDEQVYLRLEICYSSSPSHARPHGVDMNNLPFILQLLKVHSDTVITKSGK